jgi:NifU-like protein
MWDYTDKVMDLFHHPHNMGAIAHSECTEAEAVAVGEIGSIVCGDALRLHLRIDKASDRIVDARFQTFGCASAIASSSALTDLVKGMTLDEAMAVTNKNIAEFLGGLPQEKMHCSVMGKEALDAAIANYRGISLHPEAEDESPLVCKCFAVTAGKIKRLIRENELTTAAQVTNYIKAGGGCGTCLTEIDELLWDVYQEKMGDLPENSLAEKETSPVSQKQASRLTMVEKINLIQEVLAADIRPILEADGGDVCLYEVAGNLVQVNLQGACCGCPSSTATLKQLIEDKLRQSVSEDLVVEAVR